MLARAAASEYLQYHHISGYVRIASVSAQNDNARCLGSQEERSHCRLAFSLEQPEVTHEWGTTSATPFSVAAPPHLGLQTSFHEPFAFLFFFFLLLLFLFAF